ncbi:hypothetical protein [Azospirillum brasilense]|uniref:hypothetical protein n=1 Tax=Azospirillum brasilense TaxID=192 RepID=UPI000E6868D0|nr:hypothetical protein [Azospirillum brasilense]NUB24443.1 hypothetical protein [Azospirillum brasilense]NUB29911.1 hypothetical protein [Azospirillum brasilense]RIW05425.1 hypothetical protein D2T81_08065 [Azospirillum brasilense]
MAIDATTIDAAAASRPVQRERSPAQATPPLTAMESRDSPDRYEAEAEMSFGDFLDIINPLQHIPLVNTIYREITGDTIKPSSKVIGGILFGGPLGGMASIANAVVEQAQGKDIGGQVMASLGFDGDAAAGHPPAGTSGATAVAALPDSAAGTSAPAAATAAPAAQPARTVMAELPDAKRSAESSHGMGTAVTGSGRDGLADSATPHPSRMPARDTPLANSLMARYAAAKPHSSTIGFAATAAPSGARKATEGQADTAAGTGAANGPTNAPAQANVTPPAANSNAFAPVTPDMLSETMMRNLAKYEQGRRAAQTPAPSLRVSG